MGFSLNKFKTSIERQNVMHGNRYILTLVPPKGWVGGRFETTDKDLPGGFSYEETITLRAESVSFPGMSLASADGIPPRFGYGATEGVPYNIIHDDITVIFGLDDKGIVHKFFYDWLDLIVSHKAYGQSSAALSRAGKSAYEVEYKDNYCADITIYVLGPEHNELKYSSEYVMKAKIYRAYPKMIPSLNLSFEEKNNYLRFPVQFNYTDFVINHKKLNSDDIIAKPA